MLPVQSLSRIQSLFTTGSPHLMATVVTDNSVAEQCGHEVKHHVTVPDLHQLHCSCEVTKFPPSESCINDKN